MAPILSRFSNIGGGNGGFGFGRKRGSPKVPVLDSFSATGGTQIVDGSSTYNVFITSGSYVVSNAGSGNVQLLVIAGGGGGGGVNDRAGGGGGAGQVNYYPAFPITARTYNVSIGGGGVGGPGGSNGSQGGTSIFDPGGSTPVPANGGGYGGGGSRFGASNPGGDGGSGGGGIGWDNPRPGGSSVLNPLPVPGGTAYGNPGATNFGGGSGTSGGAGHSSAGGDGSAFPAFPAPVLAPAIPAPVRPAWTQAVGPTGYFGGGGATAGSNGFNVPGGYAGPTYGGGFGGGGSGAPPGGPLENPASLPAVNYTGSGGAGSWNGGPGGVGGNGGDGIIIVKYTAA